MLYALNKHLRTLGKMITKDRLASYRRFRHLSKQNRLHLPNGATEQKITSTTGIHDITLSFSALLKQEIILESKK